MAFMLYLNTEEMFLVHFISISLLTQNQIINAPGADPFRGNKIMLIALASPSSQSSPKKLAALGKIYKGHLLSIEQREPS